jgi:hypothetical protein
MKYWVGLYPEDKQQVINVGVEKLMKTTTKIFKRGQQMMVPRLTTGDCHTRF